MPKAWKGILIVVVFLVGIEIALHIGSYVLGFWNPPDPRASFAAYQDYPWTAQFYRDSETWSEGPTLWAPYVEWTRNSFYTTSINVDAEGRRLTANPPDVNSSTATQVYMLGSSALWGAGSPDNLTIPSDFSADINASGTGSYWVSNYAQGGYIFPQEVIQLATLLTNGAHPNDVIFYEGVGDVTGAYDAGTPAFEQQDEIAEKMNASPLGSVWIGVKELLKNDCLTCHAVADIARNFDTNALRITSIQGTSESDAQLQSLAQATANQYFASLAFLGKLSQAYHFNYYVFLQPSLMLYDNRIGDENKLVPLDWRLADPSQQTFVREAYADFRETTSTHFFDTSMFFASRTTAIFLDDAHVTPQGNAMMAKEMASVFLKQTGQ
jgi:hypothetical protein